MGLPFNFSGRMTAAGGVTYAYDNNGNQTARGSDTFTWDVENRLTQAAISGGSTTSYTYNGDGVRTKKTVGGVTTDYFQDVNGTLPVVAAEKAGTAWTHYAYGTSLIARLGSDGTARYYHYDGTGNVRALTDSTGVVVERYDYDDFGSLRNTPSGVSNDRRFSGEQWDNETGYTFLRARYYDPAIGRFISAASARLWPFGRQNTRRQVDSAHTQPPRKGAPGATLSSDILLLLRHFEPAFSERVWHEALVLLVGAILVSGQRTVAAILRVRGLHGERQLVNYHRVLSRARWSSLALSRILLGLLA